MWRDSREIKIGYILSLDWRKFFIRNEVTIDSNSIRGNKVFTIILHAEKNSFIGRKSNETHLLKDVMKNGGRSEIENGARHDEK